MAVAVVTQWQVVQGRRAQFITEAGEAKPIHERLGGRVRMYGATLAGANTGMLTYVLEFDDLPAYAAFSQKLLADTAWLTLVARSIGSADPSARAVSQSLLSEIPL